MKKITIAIDGYSSCGKSTLAKDLATSLGYVYVDTGAMYRAVTYYYLQKNIIEQSVIDQATIVKTLSQLDVGFRFNPEEKKVETLLNGVNVDKEIRSMEVSEHVSEVSKINEVRKKLVQIQQQLGKNKGTVIEGRDIGTVVFPDAELKFFMTASIDIRAQRRYDEMLAKGIHITMYKIKQNLESRDYEDINRQDSPLKQAPDAIVLDSTSMTVKEQLNYALKLVNDTLNDE